MMAAAALALAIGAQAEDNLGSGSLLLSRSFGFGRGIREGAVMQVRANSMWFQSATALAAWQRDQTRLSPKALKAHQDSLLDTREAWQFIYKQPVRIRQYWSTVNEVQVEMLGPGRFQGGVWWVDDKDLTR